MHLSKASIRYARALYSLAEEYGVSEQVYKNMHLLMDYFAQTREMQMLMANPIIPPAAKQKAIRLFFENRVSDISVRFISLIIAKNRATDVYGIVREYVEYYREKKGILRAVVRTAQELSPQEEQIFRSWLEEKFPDWTIEMSHKVKPELIGGFTLRIGWKFIDQSIAGKLHHLRRELNNKFYKRTN